MSYATGQPVPWPVPPDWSAGVRERLAWLTEMLPARNGVTQKREMRLAPRRDFTFKVVADAQARRVADALLFERGAQLWALPIWHDVQLLGTALTAGGDTIACDTAGFDFTVGGSALLWRSVNDFELVTIATIGASSLTLAGTLASSWPRGTRLYPTRKARSIDASEEGAWNDDAGERRITFAIDEPCDWTATLPAATYRAYPVLEHRSDEGADPEASHRREIERVDVGTGSVHYYDFPGESFRRMSHRWLLGSRAEHTEFRELLYGLRGRMAVLWVPSMTADLVLASTLGAASTALSVEWAGYTLYGAQASNRRDLRIELRDGTVYYRRITAAAEAGATETLTLDSALGAEVTPQQVRLISFMTLCEGASDAVEIDHVTDAEGITRASLAFQAVKHGL